MSSFGVIATSILTGVFCYYALGFPLLEGMLIGALLGSTDAASVFSILRSKRLNLKYNTASLLEVESGSNDPFAYMLTIIIMTILQSGSADPTDIVILIGKQLIFGLLFGALIGQAASRFMQRFSFTTSGFDSAFVLAIAVLSYAAPSVLSGNGYLSAYLAGLIIGNNPLPNKRSMVHRWDHRSDADADFLPAGSSQLSFRSALCRSHRTVDFPFPDLYRPTIGHMAAPAAFPFSQQSEIADFLVGTSRCCFHRICHHGFHRSTSVGKRLVPHRIHRGSAVHFSSGVSPPDGLQTD